MANRTANVIDGSLWRRNSGADKGRKPNTHGNLIAAWPYISDIDNNTRNDKIHELLKVGARQ